MLSLTNINGVYGYSYGYQPKRTTNSFAAGTSTSNTSYTKKLGASSKNFLSEYTKTYNDLRDITDKLSTMSESGLWNKLGAQSSDKDVLTVNAEFAPDSPATYEIDVQNLAASQENVSSTYASKEASTLGKGSLTIDTGARQYTIGYDAEGKTNEEALSSIAKSINTSVNGVIASVVANDNGSFLKLTGAETGANARFAVSASGSLASDGSLSNISRIAQDAAYTIYRFGDPNGPTPKTSSTNDIAVDSYRVSASLKDTGKSTVTIGVDTDAISKNVGRMVDAYNATVKMSENNYNMGTAIGKHMYNLTTPPTSEDSMSKIGLYYNANGTMTFDADKFDEAVAEDSDNVKTILSGSYGVAQGLNRDATNALKEPSYNLLNNTPESVTDSNVFQKLDDVINQNNSSGQSSDRDIFRLYNNIARHGVYTTMNYGAIGMLLNMNI